MLPKLFYKHKKIASDFTIQNRIFFSSRECSYISELSLELNVFKNSKMFLKILNHACSEK